MASNTKTYKHENIKTNLYMYIHKLYSKIVEIMKVPKNDE